MMAGGWLVGVFVVLLVIVAAAAVVLLTRSHSRQAVTAGLPSPRELLANRFARGEIDDEEYYLRLSALDATTQSRLPQQR
jgi:putative membrane protein